MLATVDIPSHFFRVEITESYGDLVLLWGLVMLFRSSCTVLHSCQQCIRFQYEIESWLSKIFVCLSYLFLRLVCSSKLLTHFTRAEALLDFQQVAQAPVFILLTSDISSRQGLRPSISLMERERSIQYADSEFGTNFGPQAPFTCSPLV